MKTMVDFETRVYSTMNSINYYDLLTFQLRILEGEHYSSHWSTTDVC